MRKNIPTNKWIPHMNHIISSYKSTSKILGNRNQKYKLKNSFNIIYHFSFYLIYNVPPLISNCA